MNQTTFAAIYAELPIPVVVCSSKQDFPIVYLNVAASMKFSPTHSAEQLYSTTTQGILGDILQFNSSEIYDNFCNALTSVGRVDGVQCDAIAFDGVSFAVHLYSSTLTRGIHDYHVLYLVPSYPGDKHNTYESRLAAIINATILEEDADESIHALLALAGDAIGVDRVYVIEDISPTITRNTYEWCAPGIEPTADELQVLPKKDYPYETIIESGIFVINNVMESSGHGNEILQQQGISALTIVPIFDFHTPIGYIAFADCEHPREWKGEEIEFFKSISLFISALFKRRNSERNLMNSKNVLQIITDNSEDIIYANRVDDYTLVFVSKSLCVMLGCEEEELLGRPCWEAFGNNTNGPCDFCPIPKVSFDAKSGNWNKYNWEHYNPNFKRSYLAKDTIVRWVDGQLVHMEVAVDITARTEYEERLKVIASIDTMTGVYNREYGAQTLEAKLKTATSPGCLCFIDLDNLKKTNDQYGHAVGDRLITETVTILRSQIAADDFICRWGGDEFLIWMSMPEADARAVLERATEAVTANHLEQNIVIQPGFSYGIAQHNPGSGDTLDMLVSRADKLMYQQKMTKQGIQFNRRRDDL